MALTDNWIDKIDGQDYILADDINNIAHSVQELEDKIGGGGADSFLMVVTATANESGELIIDTTFEEITAFSSDGGEVVLRCIDDGATSFFALANVDSAMAIFSAYNIADNKMVQTNAVVDSSNQAHFEQIESAPGTRWHSGTAVTGEGSVIIMPISGVLEGDYYLNTDTGAVYVSLGSNGAWSYVMRVKGTKGDKGDTPKKGVDYFTAADIDELCAAVIEQLHGEPIFGTVDGENNIILSGSLGYGTYTFAYELDDGSVMQIGTISLQEAAKYTNLFDPDTATLNQRWSNSSSSYVSGVGYVVSDFIPITPDSNSIIRFSGGAWEDNARIVYFNNAKVAISNTSASVTGYGQNPLTYPTSDNKIQFGYVNGSYDTKFDSAKYMRVCLKIDASKTITKDDVKDVIITVDEEIA